MVCNNTGIPMAVRKSLPYLEGLGHLVRGSDKNYVLCLRPRGDGSYDKPCLIDPTTYPTRTIDPDENDKFQLTLHGQLRVVSLEWLIMYSFSPLYDPEKIAHLFEVMIIDRNARTDYHPRNLTWVIPEGGVEDPEKPGYFIPPFYSAVSISKDGDIWSRSSKRQIPSRKASNVEDNTYWNVSCVLNTETHDTVAVHRLLAMACIRLENNPFLMTVNHKNGQKAINILSNIEWATYSENNLHAKNTGLQEVRRHVLVRNYRENTVRSFSSVANAAMYLGINSGAISTLGSNGTNYNGCIEVIFEEDLTKGVRDWATEYFKNKGFDINEPKFIDTDQSTRAICIYEVESKKVTVVENQYHAARLLSITAEEVLKRLLRATKFIVDGRVLCFRDQVEKVVYQIKNNELPDKSNPYFDPAFPVKLRVENVSSGLSSIQEVKSLENYLSLTVPRNRVSAIAKQLRWFGKSKHGNKLFSIIA